MEVCLTVKMQGLIKNLLLEILTAKVYLKYGILKKILNLKNGLNLVIVDYYVRTLE